ncbi:hypothetical protein FB565_008742 [Actinoplanes lutulentus]|uniref:Uncharacterized protein n=1 Tax=Actinoplanes lutulentus TaxID=1287878 RepID=A0A327Z639_9ACTN|nr:hypothetical protein [Actinoplanes lutulentus]MBB2948956.1 hypothetical protein [Actinoplanes lutulentus]RAK26261.1 hypothetical protein B0I29_128111 [Actinoplanes lutulentus]
MAEIIVEIHVPLTPTPGGPQFPWIETVEDFLVELEDEGAAESYDEGEEFGDNYVFFITGGTEKALLAAASRVATLDGVPPGAFALVTDDEADEMGVGRRVDLPVK